MFVADKHAGWCGYCNLYGSHFIGCPVAPEDPDDYYGTDDDYEDEDEVEDYEGDEDEGYGIGDAIDAAYDLMLDRQRGA